MRRPLVIYDFATATFWISLYMRKSWFSFLSVQRRQHISLPLNQFRSIFAGIHRAEVMVASNPDGVDMVENSNGKYAFFMESSSIEYLVERRCKLAQVRLRCLFKKWARYHSGYCHGMSSGFSSTINRSPRNHLRGLTGTSWMAHLPDID